MPDFLKNPKKLKGRTLHVRNINFAHRAVKENIDLSIRKNMMVDFKLTLKNAVVSDKFIDFLELQWREDISPVQLAGRFNKWLYDDEFVRENLPDLAQAGQCLLFISPLN